MVRRLWPQDPLKGVSAPRRRQIRQAVRRGEAVRDPADAPYAVALAVRIQHAAARRWRRRLLTWLLLVPLGIYWYFRGGIPLVAAWLFLFVALSVIGEVVVRRALPKTAEAERHNREIARLHGLDPCDP